MLKKWRWIAAASIALILMLTYVNHKFYFNPLTFHQDKITYLPWSWYKNPLQMEYMISGANQWKITKVQDKSEIDFVISEFKKGSQQFTQRPLQDEPNEKPMISLLVRELQDGPNSPGIVLLQAQGYKDSNIVRTGRLMEPIQLSIDLKNLIENRINEAN